MGKITITVDAPGHVTTAEAARTWIEDFAHRAASVGLHGWTFAAFEVPAPTDVTLTVDQLVALGLDRALAERTVASAGQGLVAAPAA